MKLSFALLSIFFLLIVLVQTMQITAQEMSNDNFTIFPDVWGSSTGNVTDGEVNVEYTLGEPTIDSATDGSFTIFWGFWTPNSTIPVIINYPYYTNYDVVIESYVHRSDNNPAPDEEVNFWVYAADDGLPAGDLTATFYWRTDPTWHAKQMTYNYPVNGIYGVLFDESLSAKTTMWYYVNVSDGSLSNATSVDTLYWDNPPGGNGVTEGGGGGGVSIAAPAAKGEIEILEYPASIEVERGGIEYEYVKIKNSGDGVLTDVYLRLEGIDINWYTVEPVKTNINPDEEQTFIIKLSVPDNAERKIYNVFISVHSDQDVAREMSKVDILSWPAWAVIRLIDVELPRLIRDLEATISITLENTQSEGKSVTLSLVVPEDWAGRYSTELTKFIGPSERVTYDFTITPANSGVFGLIAIGRYDDKQLSEDIIVNVAENYGLEFFQWLLSLIFVIIAIVLLSIFVILYYTNREKTVKRILAEKKRLIEKEITAFKRKILKPWFKVAKKQKLQNALEELEKARNEGLITEKVYKKSKERIIKKLKGGD